MINFLEKLDSRVKQDFYYSLLNNRLLKFALLHADDKRVTLHATNVDKFTKFKALSSHQRSTTQYLINQLNHAANKEDANKMRQRLALLGLNESQILKTLWHYDQQSKTLLSQDEILRLANEAIEKGQLEEAKKYLNKLDTNKQEMYQKITKEFYSHFNAASDARDNKDTVREQEEREKAKTYLKKIDPAPNAYEKFLRLGQRVTPKEESSAEETPTLTRSH